MSANHGETDKWIECLLGCKALPEADVRALCEKVCLWRDCGATVVRAFEHLSMRRVALAAD